MNKHDPTNKPRRTRKQLGEFLRRLGYPISDSTLNKKCAPSVGQGPPIAGWWGKHALYDEDPCVDWAESIFRPANPPAAVVE